MIELLFICKVSCKKNIFMLNFVMFEKKYSCPFVEGQITQGKIKYHKVKLGSKLIIDSNQVAYLTTKKKVGDCFNEGKFELQPGIMPKITKMCDLTTGKKSKGKEIFPKFFKGKVIFVNKQKYFDYVFKTNTILLFDRLDEFKFKLSGKFDFEIVDYDVFVKFVTKKANGDLHLKKRLSEFVSKKIRYEFHKEKYEIENFLFKRNEVFENIQKKLSKRLEKIGIIISNPKIEQFYVNEKNQEKINEHISNGDIKIYYKNIGETNAVIE